MIERWFREITTKAIRRGVVRSVPDLIAAIQRFLEAHNDSPKIFTWRKDAETILAKVAKCKEALGTLHYHGRWQDRPNPSGCHITVTVNVS